MSKDQNRQKLIFDAERVIILARKAMNEEEAMAAAVALAEKENKKVRKRPDSTIQAEPGDNSKYIRHNMMLYNLEPLSLKDADEVKERTQTYFEICAQNDMKPSVAGYALALGISRQELWRIVSGASVKPQNVRDALKRPYLVLNAQLEDYMQNGKVNPVTGIFLSKNHFAYQDKQEIEVAAKQDADSSPEELAQKYADAIPVEYHETDEN